MSLKLKNLLFEFAAEDYKSIAAFGVAEEDLIAVPEEDYENIKKEIELGQVGEVAIEDFVVRNLIEKNEKKINLFISMNQEELKIAAESKKINLMKILFENAKTQSRVKKGAAAQEHVLDKFLSVLNKKASGHYTGLSNKSGSNTTDVIIYRNGQEASSVEVKNASNFENPVAFFDKTIYENDSDKGNIFVDLIKHLFEQNNIVILSKSKLNSGDDLVPEPLDTIKSANILLSQANIKIGDDYRQCVKFSQMPDELKNNMGELTHLLTDKESNITFLCSHEVHHRVLEETGETVFFFLKPANSKLNFIYLKRELDGDEIFSRLTPKETTLTDKDGNSIKALRTKSLTTIAKIGHGKFPRAVGTSGKMNKSCFSIKLKPDPTLKSDGSKAGAAIRTEAFTLLANHLTDDYFAIQVGNEIKVITSPNDNSSDVLGLGTKKLTANDITSVQLSPYGETERGKIRVKLECALSYENFITL